MAMSLLFMGGKLLLMGPNLLFMGLNHRYCDCCRGSALVAMDLGFMGPNYSISTACATANYCFVAAANHIRKGDADIIIAGGSEAPIIPVGLGGFVACRWDCVSVVTCCCNSAELPCKKVTTKSLMMPVALNGRA